VAELVVLAFESRSKARRALQALKRLQAEEQAVTLRDWALVVRHADGGVVVAEHSGAPEETPKAAGAAGRTAIKAGVAGLVVGSLVLAPLAGLMVGTLLGATVGQQRQGQEEQQGQQEHGVDPAFLREAGEVLPPGAAALFVHGTARDAGRAIERLAPLSPRVVRTTLSAEGEAALRRRFDASAGADAPD
jgi:uncharacterized membrane protein